MMKLEDQVCSLELAKELKGLNVGEIEIGQQALWHWYYDDLHKKWDIGWYGSDDLVKSSKDCYAAFTVAELGELLPKEAVSSWRYFPDEFQDDAPKGWRWKCFYDDGKDNTLRVWADTEADARAKMLVYLTRSKAEAQ